MPACNVMDGCGPETRSQHGRPRSDEESNVLGRFPSIPAECEAVCATQERICRPATLWMAVVRRHALNMEDPGCAGDGRHQCRVVRHTLLGKRHRRVCAHEGVHCGVVCAVVSIQRILPIVSLPWAHMEAAFAVGMESWQLRTGRV